MNNYKIPTIWKRGLARAIDEIIVIISGFFIHILVQNIIGRKLTQHELSQLVTFWFIGVASFYEFLFLTFKQATIGKILLHIQVISLASKRLDPKTILIRLAVMFVPSMALNMFANQLGIVWVLIFLWFIKSDKQKRGIHDKLAQTLVIEVQQ